jgi:hypothetical protein
VIIEDSTAASAVCGELKSLEFARGSDWSCLYISKVFLKRECEGNWDWHLHLHQIGRLENVNDTFMQVLHVMGPSFYFLKPST